MTPPVPEPPATPAALRERLAGLDETAVVARLSEKSLATEVEVLRTQAA
jgi:hypothetical protein